MLRNKYQLSSFPVVKFRQVISLQLSPFPLNRITGYLELETGTATGPKIAIYLAPMTPVDELSAVSSANEPSAEAVSTSISYPIDSDDEFASTVALE